MTFLIDSDLRFLRAQLLAKEGLKDSAILMIIPELVVSEGEYIYNEFIEPDKIYNDYKKIVSFAYNLIENELDDLELQRILLLDTNQVQIVSEIDTVRYINCTICLSKVFVTTKFMNRTLKISQRQMAIPLGNQFPKKVRLDKKEAISDFRKSYFYKILTL